MAHRAGAVLFGLCLIFLLLVTAAQAVCFWVPDFWRNEYEKYDTPSKVVGGMSLDDAVHVTDDMLEYCMGRLDTLDDTVATVGGEERPFFTKREKAHLVDVRNIFHGAVIARRVALVLGLLMCLLVRRRRVLETGYLQALAGTAAAAAIIALLAMSDFTAAFEKFHHIFFDNDLWILSRSKDNLVNIMQEEVFSDAAVYIGCLWGGACLAIALLCAADRILVKKP